MYDKEKDITLNITVKYTFDSELEQLKEIINQIVNLKGLEELRIDNKN